MLNSNDAKSIEYYYHKCEKLTLNVTAKPMIWAKNDLPNLAVMYLTCSRSKQLSRRHFPTSFPANSKYLTFDPDTLQGLGIT